MRVLLAEPWWGGSHRQWAEGYQRHSAHEIRIISRPGSNWRRRMRTAGSELAADAREIMAEGWEPDVVLATDMMNVASFRRDLDRSIPVVLYMHENQLTYGSAPDTTFGAINADSVAAADLVAFNSRYHWSSFGEGLMVLDHPGALHAWERATVIPVGIDFTGITVDERRAWPSSPRILWNHRWEPDKNPDAFAYALNDIEHLEWMLLLLGERSKSEALDRIRTRFADRILADGWLNRDGYLAQLAQADIVISTATQEFFGVSIVEAIAAGAFPVLPNRLAYPELLGDPAYSEALYDDDPGPALAWAIGHASEAARMACDLALRMRRFGWSSVAPMLDRALNDLAG